LKTLERQYEHEEELLAFEAEAIHDRQEALKNPTQALKRRLSNIKKNIQPRLVDKIITDLYDKLYIPTNLFACENIAKAYEDRVLFNTLSFEAHRGDRIAIIGPNGCGKTTLLRTIVGDIPPDIGRLHR
jgi:ATP-binding cassette subfamily F protein 3